MRLNQYFDRVAYRGECRPDATVLAAVQKAHICAVPFENLDVQLGRPVTTDIEAAYEKIVINGRGGWCYEQNGLFGWALAAIGFDVTRVAASVMRHERGDIAEANHLCLLVDIPDSDDRFLVDVGFGGSMISPIRFAESDHSQAPFRLGLKMLDNDHWRFWEDIGSGEFSFDFVARPASEPALENKCEFLQRDPSSSFVLNLVAQLRLPDQHKTLRGRVFSLASCRGVKSHTIDSADEFISTLADHFLLDVPEAADLWPRIAARHEELFGDASLAHTYDIRARSHNQPLS